MGQTEAYCQACLLKQYNAVGCPVCASLLGLTDDDNVFLVCTSVHGVEDSTH